MMAGVYNIPAGIPFAKALASGLLEKTKNRPEELARMTVMLPTRRACSTLIEAFLDLSGGHPVLLPKLETIGNIDEEELSLSLAGKEGLSAMLDIPPAIHPLRRQFRLAELIRKVPGRGDSIAQSMTLAAALARLIDQIHTQGLSLANLKDLVPEDFARHWQITLKFLDILATQWPLILQAERVIDPADRRDRLIRALANHWEKHPPENPVIIAGSTGTIPATTKLLSVTANMPSGNIVLPGLDTEMNETDWQAIEAIHPQAGLKNLLTFMELDRYHVMNWPHILYENPLTIEKRTLAREITRPDDTTNEWVELTHKQTLKQSLSNAIQNTPVFETENEQQEATLIALLMRESLVHENRTCTLVTPDRNLARRVAATCRRWNIEIDDSSGQPLAKSESAVLFRLILEALINELSPVHLLALLKHKSCTFGHDPSTYNQAIWEIEKLILESRKQITFSDLINHFKSDNLEPNNIPSAILASLHRVTNGSLKNKEFNINDLIKIHLEIYNASTAQSLQIEGNNNTPNKAKIAILNLLESILIHSVSFENISLVNYGEIFKILLGNEVIRPDFGTHPRLKILGQIEARMIESDTIIMAGLNEGVWPADQNADPWMSRPMRQKFGLPDNDQNISLATHDFIQLLCSKNTIITRSKQLSRSPSIPSRWLQKLETIASAINIKIEKNNYNQIYSNLIQLDNITNPTRISPPAPTPATQSRPVRVSVTEIDNWLKDPYWIYAKKILKLKKFEQPGEDKSAAIKGTIIHETFDWFIKTYSNTLPDNALELLLQKAHETFNEYINDASLWSFWKPQMVHAFTATLNNETQWRKTAKPMKTEISGQTDIKNLNQTITITARADRIDRVTNDPQNASPATHMNAAIIDYKTGGTFSKKGLETGQYPQLILEAHILAQGGFDDLSGIEASYLGYWFISAGSNIGKEIATRTDIPELVSDTVLKLENFLDIFSQENTPYLSSPNPANALRYNDYAHLARIQEWSNNLADDSDFTEAAS
jgi:ATP-dependent helicase/nuclease subunit B